MHPWQSERQTPHSAISFLTAVLCHVPGDLDEDPGVAGDHDDEWQQEEAAEGEHVVGRLLPVGDKAPPSGTLGKVCREGDGDVVENEHLSERNKNTHVWLYVGKCAGEKDSVR